MKGSAAAPYSAKRRWKGLAVIVFALVFCSLLVPLAFLHSSFPTGYLTDERSTTESSFGSYDRDDDTTKGEQTKMNNLVKDFKPDFHEVLETWEGGITAEEVKIRNTTQGRTYEMVQAAVTESENNLREADGGRKTNSKPIGGTANIISGQKDATPYSKPRDVISHPKGPLTSAVPAPKEPSSLSFANDGRSETYVKGLTSDESDRSCQIEFGSYCLWSIEHKEILKDAMVKKLKDQLFVARAYYPSIAKLRGQEELTHEMKQQIQQHERMLGEAISDADLPPLVEKKMQKMDLVITTAKSCTVDCNNVDKKFRQLLDLTEDEAHFHMKQSAFLYHLGAQTMPKSLHCLSMRLTVEYFKSMPADIEQSNAHKLDNLDFRHYVIFTRNILAVSVAINSTVMNSEESGDMVFHLLTDRQNYFAMKLWFARNSYSKAAIHVQNIEDLNLNSSHDLDLPQLSPSEDFRVSTHNNDHPSPMQMKTEYVSVFGHSHFLLPQIFKNLKKVVVLDDDVVVQRDLSFLWNLDLGGKVNGAVEFCSLRLGQLKSYFPGSSHDGNACAWMSGLNIVDLDNWREHNVNGIYQLLLRKFENGREASWRGAALPISLLAFQDLIYPLDQSWVLSGLGHNYGVTADDMRNATTLHYNGNMKPWLDLGIPKYKKYWKKFLTKDERFMDECNVNP